MSIVNESEASDNKTVFISNRLLNIPVWVIVITIFTSLSWAWNYRTLEQHALSLALERGRYTFTMIEATRLWLAQHGIAYVARTSDTPANPYLDIAEKSISTPSGKELTAINPSYMTRQLSKILKDEYDLYINLTSLKPINPGNAADSWERAALIRFEKEDMNSEKLELVSNVENSVIRYIAPLYVKPACMKCHKEQGYEVGDVRGGISVSFDYAPFENSNAQPLRNLFAIHTIVWLILILFSILIIKLYRRHSEVIEKARDDAEILVERRTIELQNALDEIKTLQGIIPICSYCHKIRDDEGAWERVDLYISKHSDASLSHGICPDCEKTVRKDIGLED